MKLLDRAKFFSKNKVEQNREKKYSIICHNMLKNAKQHYTKKPRGRRGFSMSTRGRTRTGTAYTANGF